MRAATRRNYLSLDFGRRPRGRGRDHWIRLHRVAMACRFEVTLSGADGDAIGDASETKPQNAGGGAKIASEQTAGPHQTSPSAYEINAFCSAVRTHSPFACGPVRRRIRRPGASPRTTR